MKLVLALVFLLSLTGLKAQLNFEDLERYKDQIFDEEVKTVLLYKTGWQQSDPIIQLGTNEKLTLSFDILNDEVQDLVFTVIHCTPDWEPSNLSSHEYLPNFDEENIMDYELSFNTIQKYVNYQVEFPNEDFNISISGNYVVKVFSAADPYKVYFTKRFYIFEGKTSIEAVAKQATSSADRYYKHEVDFSYKHKGLDVTDPFSEFKVILTKNMRWDNAIYGLQPSFIRENELIYQNDFDNVFNAGNEYRYFEFRDLSYHSARTDSIFFRKDTNHVVLFSDQKRAYLKFFEQSDYNGKRIIGLENHQAFNTDADYAMVHFNLPFPNPLDMGDLYVFGQFTDFDYQKEAKMKYNYVRKRYECSMYLKQGIYNYQYVLLESNKEVCDESYIEGNHYQTKNSYKVWVYHQAISDDYYRLVGIKTVRSNQL